MALNNKTLAYFSLIAICFIWGTTFLAIGYGIESMPPLFLAGFRQVISGFVLLMYSFGYKKERVGAHDLLPIIISGGLILFISNSLVTWSLQYVPSGLGTLLFTSIPIWVVILNLVLRTEAYDKFVIIGTAIGFIGMIVIFLPDIQGVSSIGDLKGEFVLLAGCFFWAIGTVLSRKFQFKSSAVLISGIQLLFFGLLILVGSYFIESWQNIHFSNQALIAIGYLVVFDQIIGYTCYIYSLKHLPSSVVSVFAYVNPVVAISLSWLLRSEPITSYMIAGGLILFVGVYFINKKIAV